MTYCSRPSGKWRCQDRHVIRGFGNHQLVAVFDGHGSNDDAVNTASGAFPVHLEELSGLLPLDQLQVAFAKVARDTKECRSGTTAAAALLDQKGGVHLGILGDSMLIARRAEGIYTSTHHNVRANKKERARILARGGFFDGEYASKYFQGDGLQMSRAFGDCDLKPVISEEADFDSIRLEKGGWLVIMTDGVVDPASGSLSKYKKRLIRVLDSGASAKELVACFNPRHKDDATAIVCRYI